jgi:hypothetical protein
LLSNKQVIMVLTSKSDIHVFSTLGLSNCCDVFGLRGGSNRRLQKTALWGASWILLPTKYYSADQVSENEIGWPCGLWEQKNVCRVLVGSMQEKSQFEDLGVDGRMILKWVLRKQNRRAWTESGSGHRSVAGSCEHSDDPVGFIKCEEFLKFVRN